MKSRVAKPLVPNDKVSPLQKRLLIRFMNTLSLWDIELTEENIYEEIRTGILVSNLLSFHQPSLDLTGLNAKARSKKQCINNIEIGLRILFNKGGSVRNIPTADVIFDGERSPDRIWIFLKEIFDVFAMHDVNVLMQKIVNWINRGLAIFNRNTVGGRGNSGRKFEGLYDEFKDGVNMACILYLFASETKFQPDFRLIYQYPSSKQVVSLTLTRKEYLENLTYISTLAIHNNVPIYLAPEEYLDCYEPQFLLQQLYYLYCRFKHSEPNLVDLSIIVFKDEGRVGKAQKLAVSSNHSRPEGGSDMGVIDEVESMEFNSGIKDGASSHKRKQKAPEHKGEAYKKFLSSSLQQNEKVNIEESPKSSIGNTSRANTAQIFQEEFKQMTLHQSRNEDMFTKFPTQPSKQNNNVVRTNTYDDEDVNIEDEGQTDLRQNIDQVAEKAIMMRANHPNSAENTLKVQRVPVVQSENDDFYFDFGEIASNPTSGYNQPPPREDKTPFLETQIMPANDGGIFNQELFKVLPHIQERMSLFLEDVQMQQEQLGIYKPIKIEDLNQMYASTGQNQTAQFNTLENSLNHSLVKGMVFENTLQNTLVKQIPQPDQKHIPIQIKPIKTDKTSLHFLISPKLCQVSFHTSPASPPQAKFQAIIKLSPNFNSYENYDFVIQETANLKEVTRLSLKEIETVFPIDDGFSFMLIVHQAKKEFIKFEFEQSGKDIEESLEIVVNKYKKVNA